MSNYRFIAIVVILLVGIIYSPTLKKQIQPIDVPEIQDIVNPTVDDTKKSVPTYVDGDNGFSNLKEIILDEVGVIEAGGNNVGERINEYMWVTGLDNQARVDKTGEGYYWCAGFVSWGLTEAGFENPKSAWAATMSGYNRIYQSRSRDKFPLQPDNLVFGLYYKNLRRVGHTGFILEIQDDYVITVEGNTGSTGSRDGQGVFKKRRPKWAIHEISLYHLKI
jgi:hypothetical protein